MAIYDGSGRRAPVYYPINTPRWAGVSAPGSAPAVSTGRGGGPSPYNKRRQQLYQTRPMGAPYSLNYLNEQERARQSRIDFRTNYNLPDDTEPYYLGGYPESTAYAMGGGSDYLRRMGINVADQGVTVAKPKYIDGMQYRYAATNRLNVTEIAEWQSFFQMNGWKTGVYGIWGPQEARAMADFMGMANGVYGGATVEQLRERVVNEIKAGRLGPGELADTFGEGGSGAGEVGYQGPITETSKRTVITQASEADAMLLLQDILTNRLGRAPNSAEVKRFLRELNAAYRADPSVVTTTRVTDPMAGTVEETSTQKDTSVSPQGEALEFGSEADPAEAAAYQRVNVFNALMAELGM